MECILNVEIIRWLQVTQIAFFLFNKTNKSSFLFHLKWMILIIFYKEHVPIYIHYLRCFFSLRMPNPYSITSFYFFYNVNTQTNLSKTCHLKWVRNFSLPQAKGGIKLSAFTAIRLWAMLKACYIVYKSWLNIRASKQCNLQRCS